MTKTETILVRVPPDLLAKAKQMAAAQDRPLAHVHGVQGVSSSNSLTEPNHQV